MVIKQASIANKRAGPFEKVTGQSANYNGLLYFVFHYNQEHWFTA